MGVRCVDESGDMAAPLRFDTAPARQIGPGAEFACFAEFDALNEEAWKVLSSADEVLFCFVRVFYKDAFGASHQTDITAFSDIAHGFKRMRLHTEGNTSD
jgi:hypothetical protein